MRAALAVLLAAITASLYALSTSLQALEARRTPHSAALRASLIGRLLRKPLWLAGTAAGLLAWPVQAVALSLGSVALVQPALGFGLVVLLVLGVIVLHEHVGAREVAGVLAIGGAVTVLGWAAPGQTGSFTTGGTWAVGLALVVIAPAPYLLRAVGRAGGLPTSVAAGLAWAWVGLGTALLDVSLADRRWFALVGWGIGVAVTSWGALLCETTSLQTWPATRAIPLAFGAALVVAAAGAVLLGTSRAVARAATVPLTAP